MSALGAQPDGGVGAFPPTPELLAFQEGSLATLCTWGMGKWSESNAGPCLGSLLAVDTVGNLGSPIRPFPTQVTGVSMWWAGPQERGQTEAQEVPSPCYRHCCSREGVLGLVGVRLRFGGAESSWYPMALSSDSLGLNLSTSQVPSDPPTWSRLVCLMGGMKGSRRVER